MAEGTLDAERLTALEIGDAVAGIIRGELIVTARIGDALAAALGETRAFWIKVFTLQAGDSAESVKSQQFLSQ
jgi:hypothetical protein